MKDTKVDIKNSIFTIELKDKETKTDKILEGTIIDILSKLFFTDNDIINSEDYEVEDDDYISFPDLITIICSKNQKIKDSFYIVDRLSSIFHSSLDTSSITYKLVKSEGDISKELIIDYLNSLYISQQNYHSFLTLV